MLYLPFFAHILKQVKMTLYYCCELFYIMRCRYIQLTES